MRTWAKYYWNETPMKIDGVSPSILRIGDSWFWYPFVGGSLTNNLESIVARKGHIILAKGMNGAEAFDYVDDKHAGIVREACFKGGSAGLRGFVDTRTAPALVDAQVPTAAPWSPTYGRTSCIPRRTDSRKSPIRSGSLCCKP